MTAPGDQWPPLDAIPEWPDVEDLLCSYFARFGHTCTWWPPDKDENGQPLFETLLPILMIQRTGGASMDGLLDVAVVQVSAVGATRAQSWAAVGQVRRAVKAAENGTVIGGVTITEMGEVVGPQQIPGLNPDHREVPLTIQVIVQRPRF